MGIFSLFKKEKPTTPKRKREAIRRDAAAELDAVELGGEELGTDGLDAGLDGAADVSMTSSPDGGVILEAIDGVGAKVDKTGGEVRETILNASSQQNSVIQGIYRLIEERTMVRGDLNKKRREVWRVISESLDDVRRELGSVSHVIKDAGLSPHVLQKLEEAIRETRDESVSSRERLEAALGELREAQWAKLESMLGELREAEHERVDNIVTALREEAEKRVDEVRRAGEARADEVRRSSELRVFDAQRLGDERMAAHKEVQTLRIEELDGHYRKEFLRLEESYRKLATDQESQRRATLVSMIHNLDALEVRLRSAEESLEKREAALEPAATTDTTDADGAEGEDGEKKVGFWDKIIAPFRGGEKGPDVVLTRLESLELGLLESSREHRVALAELQRGMLDALKREGVERLYVIGETFDPELHACVEEVDGQPAGAIIRERRPGYRQGATVLRKAEVVVVR